MNTDSKNFNTNYAWRVLSVLLLAICAALATSIPAAENILWQDNFDDGDGDSRWFAEHGAWSLGSPTAGPQTNAAGLRAFSGSVCATTGLNGPYLANQDSRFTRIAAFTVPASNQFPRLRFWQWFAFAGPYCPFNCDEGSYGSVEIKVGNNWQQISPTYRTSGSGVWSRPSIDLSAFAGRSVQVAFRFHSAANTALGWYVDDVAVVIGQPTLDPTEGFESGFGDWSVESGTWQAGAPTSGPPTNSIGSRAFGGTNCAATVLAGSYSASVDSRLVSPPFVVPATGNWPRLRFWHWFSFAGRYCPFNCDEGSYGFVEVRVGTNAWQQMSPRYINSSSGVWSRPSMDLTPYAGQLIQIAFRLHSAAYTDVGWYVDDVAVVTGAPSFPNPEGFESGLGDWSSESGTWQVGVPSSGPPTNALGRRAFSGTNCAGTVLGGNYANAVDSRLISPTFVVPGADEMPRVRFWHWFNLAGPYCPFNCDEGSYGFVELRTATNAWLQVSSLYINSGSGVWTQPSVDLTPFAGQTVQLAFRLHSAANTSLGWYIDDVAVVTGKPVSSNPEGFELGMGDWSADSGTWQVGVPTFGPPTNSIGQRAFGGTNCAATVLGGNHASVTDSRLVSPPFVVPPHATSPNLRFRHWFDFAGRYCPFNCDEGSYGYVEVKAGTNGWKTVSPTYSGQSGGWTLPFIDLKPFADQKIQLAFHFHAANNVAPGWYVDDVRLSHDFAVLPLDSPVAQTPESACVSLGISMSTPAATATFVIKAPIGHLSEPTLSMEGCWTGTVASQADSQWLVALKNNCSSALMGVQKVGALCFKTGSAHSAFVPLELGDLTVTNRDTSVPASVAINGRTIVIAQEPLLEAWAGANQRRMLTTYGKANTTYEILQATNLALAEPWTPAWTNTMPTTLTHSSPLPGIASNAPVLFLRAKEK